MDINSECISDESIEAFIKRSGKHTLIAYGLLSLVFSLLALAVYIFFFAQNIETRGGSAAALDRLNQEISVQKSILPILKKSLSVAQRERKVGIANSQSELNAREEFFLENNKLRVLNKRKELLIKINYINGSDLLNTREENEVYLKSLATYLDEIRSLFDTIKVKYEKGEVSKQDLERVEFKVLRIDSEIRKANIRNLGLPDAVNYVNESGNFEVTDLIRINIVRFGGISVTLFLIALLIPIYRYNIRLANFYMSRADALKICRELNYGNFSEIVELLAPTHAFEKEPITPIDSLNSLTSKVLSRK